MAFSQWWSFREGTIRSDHNLAGVYEIADSTGTVIFIGSTNDMKRRLSEHLHEDASGCIGRLAYYYRVDYRPDYAAEERRLYDEFIVAYGKPPLCNGARTAG